MLKKQVELLNMAYRKKYLTINDVKKVYLSIEHGNRSLKNLIDNKYLKIDGENFGHFVITDKGISVIIKDLSQCTL